MKVKMKRKRLFGQLIGLVVLLWGAFTLKTLKQQSDEIKQKMRYIYQEVPLQVIGQDYEYYTEEELRPIRKRPKQRTNEPGAYGHGFPLSAADEEGKARIAKGWDRQGFNEEACKIISLHRVGCLVQEKSLRTLKYPALQRDK